MTDDLISAGLGFVVGALITLSVSGSVWEIDKSDFDRSCEVIGQAIIVDWQVQCLKKVPE